MTSIHITITQPDDVEAWPEQGHHLRIESFEAGRQLRWLDTHDVAVGVGGNDVEVCEGLHIMRLSSTEGSYVEEQIRVHDGERGEVRMRLEKALYPYVRPMTFGLMNPQIMNAENAWKAMTGEGRDVVERACAPPWKSAIETAPKTPGIHVAMATEGGARTIFRLPWSPEARVDVRHYGRSEVNRQRTRARYDHPRLGMILPYLAMNQVAMAMPHANSLIEDGTFERMCIDGDACGAMAIALIVDGNHHQQDGEQTLRRVHEAFPDLPDAGILLASRIHHADRDAAIGIMLTSFEKGPPCFTASAIALRDAALHLGDVKEISAKRAISFFLDPGSLFTSARI